MSKNIKFLFIYIISFIYCGTFIKLPINIIYPNSNELIDYNIKDNDTKNFLSIISTILLTNMKIGTPEQSIELSVKMEDYDFIISKYDYNNESSSSFEMISEPYIHSGYKIYEGGECSESFFISDSKLNNINFIYKINESDIYKEKYKSELGLQLYTNNMNSKGNFIRTLKENKYIDSYIWTCNFETKEIIFGGEPHEYNKLNYNKNNLKYISASPRDYGVFWDIKFNDIMVGDKSIIYKNEGEDTSFDNSLIGQLSINKNYILGNYDYQEEIKNIFFNELTEKNICEQKVFNLDQTSTEYLYYTCDFNKNKNYNINSLKKKFVNLYFIQHDLQKKFELCFDDLFIKKDDIYFFLIIFYKQITKSFNTKWMLGIPFFKKYQLIFNPDNKLIGIYNNEILSEENKEDEQKKIIQRKNIPFVVVIFLLGFLFIIIGMYIQRKFVRVKKKVIASELEDSFTLNDKNKNKKINKNKEINNNKNNETELGI